MTNPIEIRKVIGGVVLAVLWVSCFLFIKTTLYIDWVGDDSVKTPLLPLVAIIGLVVIFFYHQLYESSAETNKLSWTSVLTITWLALVIFYPFKTPGNHAAGAVGFFALMGGLAVVVFWIRFFSDEIITSS